MDVGSLIDIVKNAVTLAQKADNIELTKTLLDVQSKTIELQEENYNLKKQLQELKDIESIEADIIPLSYPFFKLSKDDGKVNRYFCSTCWGKEKKLIQMWVDEEENQAHCSSCDTGFYFK